MVKELWVRLGLRNPDFPAEDLICNGCKPENNCAYKELRSCVNAGKIKNCGFCDEYPCKLSVLYFMGLSATRFLPLGEMTTFLKSTTLGFTLHHFVSIASDSFI